MHRFANFFIVIFLTDTGLSLFDDILDLSLLHFPALSTVRNLVAHVVLILSVLIFCLLGIDRRLPKRVFLPPTLFLFWGTMAFWPLLNYNVLESHMVLVSLGQLFIGLLVILTIRWSYGHNLLPLKLFQKPFFSWRNTLGFTAVNFLLLPLGLTFFLLSIGDFYLGRQTAGFMRVSPVGIYTSERSYQCDSQVVRLVAMMHIARKEFYEELTASLPGEEAIILAEGVTDQDRLLNSKFHYNKIANAVGLTSQETMRIDGNLIDFENEYTPDKTKPDIVIADIDVNNFEKQTIEFLNGLGRTLLNNKSIVQGVTDYLEWIQVHGTPEVLSGIMKDILDKRNKVVIRKLQQSLERYNTVIIPWGGMHMPAIEKEVLNQGFVLEERKERLLFTFTTLFFSTISKKTLNKKGKRNE